MRDSRKSQMLWNNYRYRVEDDSIVIEDYCGEELDVSIPAEIEGLPVKKYRTGGIQHPRCND